MQSNAAISRSSATADLGRRRLGGRSCDIRVRPDRCDRSPDRSARAQIMRTHRLAFTRDLGTKTAAADEPR
ncbi:hypothetical protein [Palleronia sp.]|uniref:hypothetical protein n=1 Tax=Palleronia sp. TaxID=1940284 RepID=UPI0035C866B4